MIDTNNNLNLIRLFAALQVVYMHSIYYLNLWPGPPPLFRLLQSFNGVVIFFIISGFLVTDSYLKSTSIGEFAKKRMLRIYPALVVNILMIEMMIYLTGGFGHHVRLLRYAAFLAVFLTTASMDWGNYLFGGPYESYGFFLNYPWGVLWTLTAELSFYLMLPILLEVWRRSSRGGAACLAVLAAGSLLLAQYFDLNDRFQPFVSITVAPYFWIFAIGIAARMSWSCLQNFFKGKALIWIAVHTGIVVIAHVHSGSSILLNFQSPDILDMLSIFSLAALTLSIAYTWPLPNMLHGCDFSFGIYLNHAIVLQTLLALGYVEQAGYWPLAIGSSVVAGAASWFLIEKPFLRLKSSSPGERDKT